MKHHKLFSMSPPVLSTLGLSMALETTSNLSLQK
jgi:hypothetical protein